MGRLTHILSGAGYAAQPSCASKYPDPVASKWWSHDMSAEANSMDAMRASTRTMTFSRLIRRSTKLLGRIIRRNGLNGRGRSSVGVLRREQAGSGDERIVGVPVI